MYEFKIEEGTFFVIGVSTIANRTRIMVKLKSAKTGEEVTALLPAKELFFLQANCAPMTATGAASYIDTKQRTTVKVTMLAKISSQGDERLIVSWVPEGVDPIC